MRTLFVILALSGLAACTTPQSVSEGAPFFAGQTEKDQNAVAGCVAAAWGVTKNFHSRVERRGDVVAVILSGSSVAGIDMIVNIHPGGAVDMHRRPAAWGSLDDKLAAEVRGCL